MDNELLTVLPAEKVTLKHSQKDSPSRFIVLVFAQPLTDAEIDQLRRLLDSHLSGVVT